MRSLRSLPAIHNGRNRRQELAHCTREVPRPLRVQRRRLIPESWHSRKKPANHRAMAAYERAAILHAVQMCNGNRREAAQILDIGEATLYRKLKVYGIKPDLSSARTTEAGGYDKE